MQWDFSTHQTPFVLVAKCLHDPSVIGLQNYSPITIVSKASEAEPTNLRDIWNSFRVLPSSSRVGQEQCWQRKVFWWGSWPCSGIVSHWCGNDIVFAFEITDMVWNMKAAMSTLTLHCSHRVSQWLWEDPCPIQEFLEACGLGVLVEQLNQPSKINVVGPRLCVFLVYATNSTASRVGSAGPMCICLLVDTWQERQSTLITQG